MKEAVIELAVTMLKVDEGFMPSAYHDHLGYPTRGFGEKLSDERYSDLSKYPDVSIEEGLEFLRERLRSNYDTLDSLDYMKSHETLRSAIVLCMSYQLGIKGLQGFKKTLASYKLGCYSDCSEEMLQSKWARQTKNRAERYSAMMKEGELCQYYQH